MDVLTEVRAGLGTNEIARRTGVNVSSISRLLSTLTETGLVQYVPYTDGTGSESGSCSSPMRRRRAWTGAGSVARSWKGSRPSPVKRPPLSGTNELFTADFVASPQSVRSVAQLGRNSVGHATAAGKVFLAWGCTSPEGELICYTDRTITDRGTLQVEIDKA